MPRFADLKRSLTAKVLLGLLGLGVAFGVAYVAARFAGIRSSVEAREGARAQLVAEPMRFALESLAERHPEITEQTGRVQRLVEHLSKTGGVLGVAVTDPSARRFLAYTGSVAPLRGTGDDLPQRAQSLDRTLIEPSPDGRALLLAVPLRRPAEGQAPSEAFGVLLMQYDLVGPVAERQIQTLRDLGVLVLGLLVMAGLIIVGLRIAILKPLASLAGQAAALGAGDLAARSGVEPPPGGGDEIARLAAGFDRMAAELEAAAKAQRSLNEELRASEARGRAVFEHASIAISQGDPLGRIVDANPAFLRLWGYTLEELKGVRWIDLTHPDDRAESLRQSGRLLAGEIDGFALEKRYVRGDGQIVWASVNVACMRGEMGQVEMLVLVAEDISPRIAAEEARAERQQLFQAMFENNQAMQVLVDPDTATIIDANRAAAAFYGYSREEILGPVSRINPMPEERILAIMGQAREQGGVYRVPHRLKSGEERQMELTIASFRLGARALLHTTLHDITERLRAEQTLRETEERLRSLIELMHEGVVLTSSEGRLRYVNPAFARMLGEEPAALEGRPYIDLLAPETAATQPERHAARRRGSREPYEARYLRRDGSVILARVTPFPMFNGEGEYQGSCAIIQDITEARASEQADQLRRKRRSGLLRLHGMHSASRQELLDFSLEQLQELTASPLGYIYAYDDTRRKFTLHSWSEGVMEQCAVQDKKTEYELDATGVWGDAVRLREPVMLNDFAAPHPGRKGLPEGHVRLSRFLTLPVIRAGRVVAVVGMGNKERPYDDEDIIQLRLFTDGLWSVLERQEALAELKAVTERFHLAVRAGRIGLWDWDLKSGAMHCDAFMEKAFGLSGQNLTGTPEDWICRVHPEDRPRVRQALELARATGERIELSFRVRRPDSSVVHMTTQAVTYRGPVDEPLRMVGVIMDVTSQRHAEEQLAESHRFLQSVIDTLPTPFVCKDGDGRYLLVNQAFTSLYGLPPEQILGRTMGEFLSGGNVDRHMAEDARLLSDPSAPSLEYEVDYAPPGEPTRHWLVVKSHLPLSGGRRPGLAAITLDITARKRAEEALRESEVRFRTLTQISPVGIFQADMRGRCTYVNDQWSVISGFPPSAALGQGWLKTLRPGDRKVALAGFREMVRTGQDYVAEFRFHHKDDSGKWILMHSALERASDGTPTGFVGALTDISDLKAAEDLLREERRRLSDVIEGTAVGTWEWNVRTGEVIYNERWALICGYTLAELAPTDITTWQRLAHPDDLEASGRLLASHFAGESEYYDCECRMRHKDGSWVWVQDRGRVASRDAEGSPLLMSGTHADITARKQAEQALRESEARFRELAALLRLMCDNVPDMIWAKDLEKRYLFANKALCEGLLGAVHTAEPVGKDDLFFALRQREAHKDDPAWHTFGEICQDSDDIVLTTGTPGQFGEYGNVRGQYLFLDVRKAPFVNDQGEVLGTVGTARDITEQKRAEDLLRESEERFRDLFLDAPLPYQSLDGNGNLLLANDAWLNTLGYRREEVIGKSFADFLRPDQIPLTMEVFPRFKESGVLNCAEFVMRRKDGSELLASFNGRVSRDEEGRFIRTHCTFQDITERRRAEESLSRAKAEAEAATLAKAQFLANMSHEIRTPLSGVIGAAKLLSQSRLSPDQRQLADMAVESGRALLEIVNDILDFSKIEAGRLDLRPEPFALRADLEAVVAPFRLLAGQRGINLRLIVDLNAPDHVVGDHGRLDQVLRNLLGNAVKFTDSGSITLDVATDPACPRPQSSACLRFTVRDTGIGIAPDYLPYIFDSFSQADDSYSKRHGGTGLGLAISRSLVERMGGQLVVTSIVNQGSAFSFTLCLALAERPQTQGAHDPASTDSAPARTSGRTLRVLLAEDAAIGRTLLTRILAEAGHAVEAVADGRQALEALARERFDLVLMDVQMPEVDGLAATRAIRQGQTGAHNADIPIVALTAYIQREDRERFLRAGMDDYVPKPVEERELLAAMERVLALRGDFRTGFGQQDNDKEDATVRTSSPAQAPRFDTAYIERAFGDRKDLLADLLAQFRDVSLPEVERNLREAIAAGDLDTAHQVAHKAKGTFGTVGARRAAVLAHSLEMAAAAGNDESFQQRAKVFLAEAEALAEHLRHNRPWPDGEGGEEA